MVETAKIRNLLLICGILSSLLYVGTDILAGALYEGYSFTSQYVSELSAIGAPTRPLVVPLFLMYSVLSVAFALGVWELPGGRRVLRFLGGLLVGLGVTNLVAYFFPIHLRGVEATFTDTMHAVLTVVTVLFILLAVGFGAAAYRNWFRFYSIGTILILPVPGILGFLFAPHAAANMPAPWVGLAERITIYGWMLWVGVLAIVLLRAEKGLS